MTLTCIKKHFSNILHYYIDFYFVVCNLCRKISQYKFGRYYLALFDCLSNVLILSHSGPNITFAVPLYEPSHFCGPSFLEFICLLSLSCEWPPRNIIAYIYLQCCICVVTCVGKCVFLCMMVLKRVWWKHFVINEYVPPNRNTSPHTTSFLLRPQVYLHVWWVCVSILYELHFTLLVFKYIFPATEILLDIKWFAIYLQDIDLCHLVNM